MAPPAFKLLLAAAVLGRAGLLAERVALARPLAARWPPGPRALFDACAAAAEGGPPVDRGLMWKAARASWGPRLIWTDGRWCDEDARCEDAAGAPGAAR